MSKTIVLTPGAWHSPEIFSRVVPTLEAAGYQTILVEWPSSSRGALPSIDDDIAHIRDLVGRAADGGSDIVIVSHSWSGLIINSAVADFSKDERAKQGKQGGIVKLVFLCAFMVPKGVSLFDAVGRQALPFWNIQGDVILANKPEETFYNDLSAEDAKHWASLLRPQSKASFYEQSRGAAYMSIPSCYLICEEDNAIAAEGQEMMVKAAQEGGAPLKSERMKASHSPFLSRPAETVEFILRVASS